MAIKPRFPHMLQVFMVVLFSSLLSPLPLFSEETFTISTSYRNLLSNEESTGLLDQLLTEAFMRIGKKVEFVYTGTAKSLVDVNAGVFDGEINRIAGMEKLHPNLRQVPEANMIMEFVAFSRKPWAIDGWESIRSLDIGLVRGWIILEEHTRDFPHVVKVPTENELFNMLRLERIDVALYSKLTGYAVIKELGIQGVSHLEPPLARREMFLYVHKKHENLLEAVAEALRSIKQDGTYERIRTEIERRYEIPVR